jgi:hypothetical protein
VPTKRPRFFQFSIGAGVVESFEIFDYCQDDLDQTAVFMLDTWDKIYLWFGSKAKESTKLVAMETAINFVKATPPNQPRAETPIVVVKQPYQEPLEFIQYFFGWSDSLYPNEKVSTLFLTIGD